MRVMVTNPLVRVAIDPGLECVPLGGPVRAHRPGVETRLGSRPSPAHPASGHPWGGASPTGRVRRGEAGFPASAPYSDDASRAHQARRLRRARHAGPRPRLRQRAAVRPTHRRRDGDPRVASCPRCSATSSDPPSSSPRRGGPAATAWRGPPRRSACWRSSRPSRARAAAGPACCAAGHAAWTVIATSTTRSSAAGGAAERPRRYEPRVAGGSKGHRGAHRGRRQLTSVPRRVRRPVPKTGRMARYKSTLS